MQKCPVCKESTKENFRPFCSRRCMLLDLSKWLDSSYSVPLEEKAEDSEIPFNGDLDDKKKL